MLYSAVVVVCLLQWCGGAYAVLVPGTQLTTSQLRRKALQSTVVRYSNDWAVQINGSSELVDTIASSNGFINMGQVCLASYIVFLVM